MDMVVEKDWKALIGNLCWSWILCWIPAIPKAIDIANTSYSFDGSYTLTYSHGIVSKKNDNFDLRRLKSINAEDNFFTGGKLTLIGTNGVTRTLPYVKNARTTADSLMHLVDEASRARGDVQNRIIA